MAQKLDDFPDDPDVLINSRQLREIIPVSAMTIWRWDRDPRMNFPKRIKMPNGRVFRNLAEIRSWIRTQARAREAAL